MLKKQFYFSVSFAKNVLCDLLSLVLHTELCLLVIKSYMFKQCSVTCAVNSYLTILNFGDLEFH